MANGLRNLTLEFYNSAHVLVSTMGNHLLIDKNYCVASIDLPLLDGQPCAAGVRVLKIHG